MNDLDMIIYVKRYPKTINILKISRGEGCLGEDWSSELSSAQLVSGSGKHRLDFHLHSSKLQSC